MSADSETLSTGTTEVTTTDDTAVTLLDNSSAKVHMHEVIVFNSSINLGFVSIDGGVEWCPLPGGSALTFDLRHKPTYRSVKLKRVPSGSNVTAYAFAY